MRGTLVIPFGEKNKPQQLTGASYNYTLEIPQEGRAPKVVNCVATVWRIENTNFVVSKLQLTATGNMVLHIMGLYSELTATQAVAV